MRELVSGQDVMRQTEKDLISIEGEKSVVDNQAQELRHDSIKASETVASHLHNNKKH